MIHDGQGLGLGTERGRVLRPDACGTVGLRAVGGQGAGIAFNAAAATASLARLSWVGAPSRTVISAQEHACSVIVATKRTNIFFMGRFSGCDGFSRPDSPTTAHNVAGVASSSTLASTRHRPDRKTRSFKPRVIRRTYAAVMVKAVGTRSWS